MVPQRLKWWVTSLSLVIDHSPSAGVPFSWISPKKRWDPYFESANACIQNHAKSKFASKPPNLVSFILSTWIIHFQPPPTTLPFPNHPSICSGSPNPTRSWWDTIQVEGAQQAIIPAGKPWWNSSLWGVSLLRLIYPPEQLTHPHPRYVWKWCSNFPFPVWEGYGIVPLEGIYSLNKSWSFSCCAHFLQWQFWKSPPGQSAWSCCVHPRRPRCEALYETIQPNSCTPWLTVRSWKLMLGRKFTFWEKEIVSDAMLGSGVLLFCCWGLESLGCSATWGDSVG